MLSILIPVYNYNVRKLVLDLLDQINSINNKIELILLDDGSDDHWQGQYVEWGSNSIIKVEKNSNTQGRVGARKQLVELSDYDNLIFIDCDAAVIHGDYLNNYISEIDNYQFVCGGHVYQNAEPSEEFVLHWKYGKEVEVRSLKDRVKSPYQSFSTFNFCCKKSIFINYLNEINVEGYGHEDTLIGHILLKNKISIRHVNNELMHVGLKETDKFIDDIESAIDNAFLIQENCPEMNIRLLKNVARIKKSGVSGLVKWILGLHAQSRLASLKSNNPSIRSLQLHKLYYSLSKHLNI